MSRLTDELRSITPSPDFRRPPPALAVLLDGSLSCLIHIASYWLRFTPDQLSVFLPAALATTPIVVAGQLCGFAFALVYTAPSAVSWARIVVGAILGTALALAGIAVSHGHAGVSRGALGADAAIFIVATLTWRGAWALIMRSKQRTEDAETSTDLIDRASELTTIRSIVSSLYRYRELLKNLVLKDLKLKYRGSVFGFLWSLANPLLMLVVYTLAFTFILRIRNAGFVFYLMLGLLSWTFFANSAGMATGAIVDNAGLLKSVLFPRAILPIATVLFNLAQYVLTVAVFLPAMMLWYRVYPATPMVLFPVFLLLHVVFTIGIALTLATATAFFRDVRHLLEVTLAVLFWTTPIVYELHQVPERLQLLILLSPVSSFVVAYQQIFYYRVWPEPTVWVIALIQAVGAFVFGSILFLANENRFTEQL